MVYGQLADKPTRRQTNSLINKRPEIAIIIYLYTIIITIVVIRESGLTIIELELELEFRLTPKMETMKVALFRSSLERRGGINVRSFILNVLSQLIGVKYETRSGRKRRMQNNSICLLYLPVK